MKGISILFWTFVAGVGLSFVGSVYTAVKISRATPPPSTTPIAVPAIAPQSS